MGKGAIMASTLVKRVGGKVKLRDWIRGHLPNHNIYVEPFGGSFAVGLNLPRLQDSNYRVVYNDLDSNIYNFFKVLRDQKSALMEYIRLTPYSRQEFEQAYDILSDKDRVSCLTELERARLYLVLNRQSFAGKEDGTWSISRQGENIAHTWEGLECLLEETAGRLKHAYIENSDYVDIFRRWDSEETVFYIDPPYWLVESDYYDVNKSGGFDHVKLAEEIKGLKGSVVVSYYESKFVLDLYSGFEIERRSVVKHMQTKEEKDSVVEVLLIRRSEWSKRVDSGYLVFGE